VAFLPPLPPLHLCLCMYVCMYQSPVAFLPPLHLHRTRRADSRRRRRHRRRPRACSSRGGRLISQTPALFYIVVVVVVVVIIIIIIIIIVVVIIIICLHVFSRGVLLSLCVLRQEGAGRNRKEQEGAGRTLLAETCVCDSNYAMLCYGVPSTPVVAACASRWCLQSLSERWVFHGHQMSDAPGQWQQEVSRS
jgi:hypothetical protein